MITDDTDTMYMYSHVVVLLTRHWNQICLPLFLKIERTQKALKT